MKTRHTYGLAIALSCIGSLHPAYAQQSTLPEVEIQQKKAAAAKAKAAKKAAAPKPAPQPAAEPVQETPVEEASPLENSPYGATNSQGAAARAATGPISPINARQVLPDNLQNFTSAGTRVTSEELDQRQPLTNHQALAAVPGVITTDDDGMGRHSGIGMRGSPTRRSRKVLVMEDGLPINFSPYLDSSTHYTPPIDRIESIEVMRGPVVNYGPLTNHGVVNFRNLSPFGANETEIRAAIGTTEGSNMSVNNMRHVHTRQNVGNAGIVVSYSGADGAGAWDNEELRYNDFYGAIGLKGSNQDLTVSGGYFRQRDQYDETNFVPTVGGDAGLAQFFANGYSKLGTRAFNANNGVPRQDFADLSSYNADYWRVQATHNLYIDDSTTLTSRLYYSDHERNRFFFRRDRPQGFAMRGRERDYDFYGAESRLELADRPFIAGMTQTIQAGARYEHHDFTNCNSVGNFNEVLDANNGGRCDGRTLASTGDNSRVQTTEADSFSAFVQSAIQVNSTITVTPGVRFESYQIDRLGVNQEFAVLNGRDSSDHDYVLPMIAFAWEAMPRITLYGGYHRGFTPQITRGPDLPLPDEVGDNFQLGIRSTAVKGLTIDMAYFHSLIENYQVKAPNVTAAGNNIFGAVDEVEIEGFEVGARLESKPFTGGPWNFFTEGAYTFADSRIEQGRADNGASVAGNLVPEVQRHFTNLTLGFAHAIGFDAGLTWTYRGGFFTDIENSRPIRIGGGAVLGGFVDDIWLLSARSNLKVTDSISLFVAGTNLTDEFYVTDIDEGIKPGQGRTIMGGFTLRFE